MTTDPTHEIRQKALDIGFDAVGITSAQANPRDGEALSAFLKQGRHGLFNIGTNRTIGPCSRIEGFRIYVIYSIA